MKILVVEDDEITRIAVKSQLENPGIEKTVSDSVHFVTAVGNLRDAERVLQSESFDYAFIDLKLSTDRMAGFTLLKNIAKNYPSIIPIMMTSNTADETVEDCLRNGAADYIYKPFDVKSVHMLMRKARIIHKLRQYSQSLKQTNAISQLAQLPLKSKNPQFQLVIEQIKKFRGKSSLNILIRGESGVGKEVFTQYLNAIEDDPLRVLISVNCSAIPENLIESELFGHVKGAFSGAIENKIGKFAAADDGDIFLDEVATMSPEMQTKILRVLQDKMVTPVGSNHQKKYNFRVISATNEDLEELVHTKKFREDLFYRLQAAVINIPPLRERMEDLEDLVYYFLAHSGNDKKTLSPEAWELCRNHRWPGNVRELKHAIEVASVLADGDEISASDIQSQLQNKKPSPTPKEESKIASELPFGLTKERIRKQFNSVTEEFEQALYEIAHNEMGSVQGAANYLGLSRNTLNYKLKTWGWNKLT
jgi:DNA-binding NtrC family response regulator